MSSWTAIAGTAGLKHERWDTGAPADEYVNLVDRLLLVR